MRRVRVNIQCDTQPFSTAAFFVPQTRLFPRRPTAWPYQQRLFCGWKKLCWALESIVSALVTTTPISSQVIWAVATWSVVIYGMVWSKWRRWECGRIHPLTMSHLKSPLKVWLEQRRSEKGPQPNTVKHGMKQKKKWLHSQQIYWRKSSCSCDGSVDEEKFSTWKTQLGIKMTGIRNNLLWGKAFGQAIKQSQA